MGNEKRDIPQWCKDAKKAMIDVGISGPKELGQMLGGHRREYISAILNGRVLPSDELKNRICILLNERLSARGLRYSSLDV